MQFSISKADNGYILTTEQMHKSGRGTYVFKTYKELMAWLTDSEKKFFGEEK